MARAVAVLHLALSILATSVVAEVLTCPSGDKECFEKDDMESLLQHQHSVASGSDRPAIMIDKEASGSNASSNRFEYQGWSRSAPNNLPNKDGFYDADTKPNNKKCFLSKNSVFTVPSTPDTDPWFSLPRTCRSSTLLRDLENAVVQGSPCVECRNKLQGMMPISGWVAECGQCAEWWNKACLTDLTSNRRTQGWDGKKFADQVFAHGQQPFMIELAKALSNHGVSLYLDFADADAERLVEHFHGRTVQNWPDALTFGMMELLAERARADGVEVVHWAGATKSFCEAELAGALRGAKMPKVLLFPPMYYTESMTSMPAVCNTCSQSDACPSSLSIASQVCSLCGGNNCGNIDACSRGRGGHGGGYGGGGGAARRERSGSQGRRDSGGGYGGGGGAGRLPRSRSQGCGGSGDSYGGGSGAGRLPPTRLPRLKI